MGGRAPAAPAGNAPPAGGNAKGPARPRRAGKKAGGEGQPKRGGRPKAAKEKRGRREAGDGPPAPPAPEGQARENPRLAELRDLQALAGDCDRWLAGLVAQALGEDTGAVLRGWRRTPSDLAGEQALVAPVLQAHARGFLARVSAHQRRAAGLCIQSAFRGFRSRRETAVLRAARRDAQRADLEQESATRIQRSFKVYRARHVLSALRETQARFKAAVTLQAGARGMRDRGKVRESRKDTSVCVCGGQPNGAMISCGACFDYFHLGCVGLGGGVPLPGREWVCPDCDLREDPVLGAEPAVTIGYRKGAHPSAALVRVNAVNEADLQRLAEALERRGSRAAAASEASEASTTSAGGSEAQGHQSRAPENLPVGAAKRLQGLASLQQRLEATEEQLQRDLSHVLAARAGLPLPVHAAGRDWQVVSTYGQNQLPTAKPRVYKKPERRPEPPPGGGPSRPLAPKADKAVKGLAARRRIGRAANVNSAVRGMQRAAA